ncbi:MAG: hypothetical protein ACI8TQ_002872 [Planctomycetota bacterium]|jgi:hypothetical protein
MKPQPPRSSVNKLHFLVALMLLCTVASAQFPSKLTEQSRISLLTLSPGDEVHTFFGHGTLRVVDSVGGKRFDASFNYGTFEFGDGFIQKFLYGELDYTLSVLHTQASIDEAASDNRSVVEQELYLTLEQRQRLYDALIENSQPENRTYRYDFLFDNCSTRLVDMLRDTLGDGLVFPTGPYEPRDFRTLLEEHVVSFPWVRFGFDLLLGATLEREASFEESWFLPRHFMAAVGDATLDGHALVSKTVVLNDSGQPDLPFRTLDQANLLSWILLAFGAIASFKDSRGRLSRILDACLFASIGLIGLVLALMWGATRHHVTAQNWNLIWAWPTHLLAAIFLVRRGRPNWLRAYLLLTVLGAACAALGMGTPLEGWGYGVPQDFAPAILPLGLLIALRAWMNIRNLPPTKQS